MKSKRPKFSSQDARLSGLDKVDSHSSAASQYKYKSKKSTRSRSSYSSKFEDRPIVTKQSSKPKWKVQSEQFRAAMMAARGEEAPAGSSGMGYGHGAGPVDDGLIPCPHCGRTFNETAAERHIERCKNMKSRPKTLKAGAGRGAYQTKRKVGHSSSMSRSSSSSSSYRF